MLIIRYGEDVESMNNRYDGLTLEFILSLVLKHGSIVVLMNGYICLYTHWILVLETGTLKLNFSMALRIGPY